MFECGFDVGIYRMKSGKDFEKKKFFLQRNGHILQNVDCLFV